MIYAHDAANVVYSRQARTADIYAGSTLGDLTARYTKDAIMPLSVKDAYAPIYSTIRKPSTDAHITTSNND